MSARIPIAYSGITQITCFCITCQAVQTGIPVGIPLNLVVPPGLGNPNSCYLSEATCFFELAVGDAVGLPCGAVIATGSQARSVGGRRSAFLNSTFSNGQARITAINQLNIWTAS